MEAELQNPSEPPQNPCFDAQDVFDNCTKLYVRVNVHFILDNNCEGNLAAAPGLPEDLSPENAFLLAEQLISNANSFYDHVNDVEEGQWNQSAHNAIVTEHHCIPLRYILSGVHFHCSTTYQSISSIPPGLSVNGTQEVNLFVANVPAGTSGFASGRQAVVENFGAGLFNHELGHVYSLGHTHSSNDFCLDTWPHNWTLDGGQCAQDNWLNNCDGTAELTSIRGCWGTGVDHRYTRANPLTTCLFANANSCDTEMFCTSHPCCAWENQNNNVMCYSKWAGNSVYATLTPCQIERTLNELSGNMCAYLEQIGGECPPPYANIGVVPLDGISSSDCSFCVHLEASMNDEYYQLEVKQDIGNGNFNTVAQTGWLEGPAGVYCVLLHDDHLDKNRHVEVQPGNSYLFTLTVESACQELHETTVLIDIPPGHPSCIPEVGGIEVIPYPNPTTGPMNLQYILYEGGEVQIYLIEALTGQRIDILHEPSAQVGSYNTTVNLASYYNGVFFLVYRLKEEIHIETVLKI